MTPLLAACDKLLELDSKVTPGPWDAENANDDENNGVFLALSRTFAPRAAKALKEAISGLEIIAASDEPGASKDILRAINEAFDEKP